MHDLANERYTVHDRKRAETRYVPASTFKIPNSLIGLSTGVVADVDQVLPYGGGPTRRPEWAQDMSLRDAIRISNLPLYQNMALYTFAPNLDIPDGAAGAKRVPLGKASLQALGLL